MANGSQNLTTYLSKGLEKVITTNALNTDNLLYINTNDTNITADTLGSSNSIAFTRMNTSGAYTTGHIVWLNAANIGTPFQLVVHDSSDLYFYKRYKRSDAWTAWTKMNAGYADSAGAFSSNATVTLTGDATGTSAGSTKSWSIPTTVTKMSLNGGRISTPNTTHAAADYGKLYFLISSSSMDASGVKPKFSTSGEAISACDGFILDAHWDNSGHYNAQIAWRNSANALSIRTDPNSSWSEWVPIITTQNAVTGDANGQIKLGGKNISVKGLGSNAFNSIAYLPLAGGTMTGTLSWNGNINSINFRTNHASYDCIATYRTAGNEAMCFTTKNAVTSFLFYNGEDSITNSGSDRWYSIIGGVQIKNNCLAINAGWANGTNPDYRLKVGGNMYVSGSGQVVGQFTATNDNNFIYHTNEFNFVASGYSNVIYFNYRTQGGQNGNITGYRFCNGTGNTLAPIYGSLVYGAVWNDYAEFRQCTTLKGGYCVRECPDGIMQLTTERLEPSARLTSDTYGFAIGETDKSKTPIAVCGRVLVYTYQDRNNYKLGDAVCSAPNGTVDIMTREEIMMYPERIVGTVSEIPDYDIWYAGDRGGRKSPSLSTAESGYTLDNFKLSKAA